jgi:hypothetical protein
LAKVGAPDAFHAGDGHFSRHPAVRDWLSRIDKDDREKRDKRIFELLLSCHTYDEIADIEDISKSVISEKYTNLFDFAKASKTEQIEAQHLADFDPPIYNIWKQQSKPDGVRHFGNSEAR